MICTREEGRWERHVLSAVGCRPGHSQDSRTAAQPFFVFAVEEAINILSETCRLSGCGMEEEKDLL